MVQEVLWQISKSVENKNIITHYIHCRYYTRPFFKKSLVGVDALVIRELNVGPFHLRPSSSDTLAVLEAEVLSTLACFLLWKKLSKDKHGAGKIINPTVHS